MRTTTKISALPIAHEHTKKKWSTPAIIKLQIKGGLTPSNTESESLNPSLEDS
ncbi:hypothetical protein [Emticicia sp. TH156]|uniref:hypothetical protein n=1 Tax=Emticicia sp. TH156 TaxID=2067454 RepID=UPI00130461E6|nr:hypothetical protein [Emticicia sp. TH156]